MPQSVPELQAALMEARAARAAAVKELATMRRQLTHAQSALDDAQKVGAWCGARTTCNPAAQQTVDRVVQNASNVKQQLEAESSRAFKLEVEAAELKKQLERVAELERELEQYRVHEADKPKQQQGLWSYISGAS